MNKKDKSIIVYFILTIIKNTIPMICFTILAINFNKWWISLFSILFWSSISLNNKEEKNEDNRFIK